MTQVVNVADGSVNASKFRIGSGHGDCVYIGRDNASYNFSQSKFHNPYVVGEDGTRREVVNLFREYFHERMEKDSDFQRAVSRLRGKTLGCWCKPSNCHGDVIVNHLDTASILEL